MNSTPHLAITAGQLQPRNIDSIVTVRVLGSTIVGTLESYSVMPDGKNMNLRLRGTEAVLVPSSMVIELSRSSDYTSRIARSLSLNESIDELLLTVRTMLKLTESINDATHDIADVVDVPDDASSIAPITPLIMATA